MYDEYPHVVNVLQLIEVETDETGSVEYDELGNPIYIEDELGNNVSTNWQSVNDAFVCFVDTPKSFEVYTAMQNNHKLDRFMYYPYNTDITAGMRVEHDGTLYEVTKKPENQGGLNEIMRVALSEVSV